MRVAAAMMCLSATACAFGPQLTRVAVDHNDLVANSANELVLVNILRARDREPLHFTSVSKLVGDAQFTAIGEVGGQVKGPLATVKTNDEGELVDTSTASGQDVTLPRAQLQLSGKSSMDVAVWDTQEFYQGIVASAPPATIAHYLHQGWPREIMTHLFIGSVDFYATESVGPYRKGQLVDRIVNDPYQGSRFASFAECFQLRDYVSAGSETRLIAVADFRPNLALADVALLDGDKFDLALEKDPGGKEIARWVARKSKGGDSLGLVAVNTSDKQGATCPNVDFALVDKPDGKDEARSDERTVVAEGILAVAPAPGLAELRVPVEAQVVLRSVDGVIYYLGEYLRAEHPPLVPTANAGPVRLLNIVERRPARTFVTAKFKGKRYYVPATDEGRIDQASGRSSQVFALVEQLLNLQKSSKDRPTTQTVRVVQ